MTKRAFDLVLALASLPLALPIIAICAAAVKLTSPGPAILRQVRVGRHEKPFIWTPRITSRFRLRFDSIWELICMEMV
ncbi:sugar transferase, partial [Chelativorans sp. SCAU2101]